MYSNIIQIILGPHWQDPVQPVIDDFLMYKHTLQNLSPLNIFSDRTPLGVKYSNFIKRISQRNIFRLMFL